MKSAKNGRVDKSYIMDLKIENKIILIGGSPTVGKSYVARKLAEDLKLPWISTDTVREQMRKIVRKEDYPALCFHSGATSDMAVEFLTHKSAEDIVRHQNGESLEVWKGVKALIETDYVWQSFIIEGVAILPQQVHEIMLINKKVKSLFLIDENKERVRDIIFTRGLWDDADKYPDSVKEKEVEWVFAFNDWIKDEAGKYNLPVINIGTREKLFEEVKSILDI